MPWHDVHMTLTGEAVLDIVQHFVERWNEVKKRKVRTYFISTIIAADACPLSVPGGSVRVPFLSSIHPYSSRTRNTGDTTGSRSRTTSRRPLTRPSRVRQNYPAITPTSLTLLITRPSAPRALASDRQTFPGPLPPALEPRWRDCRLRRGIPGRARHLPRAGCPKRIGLEPRCSDGAQHPKRLYVLPHGQTARH